MNNIKSENTDYMLLELYGVIMKKENVFYVGVMKDEGYCFLLLVPVTYRKFVNTTASERRTQKSIKLVCMYHKYKIVRKQKRGECQHP